MTINLEGDSKFIQMAIDMKANLLMESLKGLVLTFGQQVKFMKVSGKGPLNMVQECGKALMETVIPGSGIQDKLKVMESIYR